jgi:hypothetical protein
MIAVSYNGNLINDGASYQTWFISPVGSLPPLTAHMAKRYAARPRLGGVGREGQTLTLLVRALAGSRGWLRALFNGEDGTPKLLVAADDDGSNQRYLPALCVKFEQTTQPGVFVAEMQVDDEARWRAVTPTTAAWNITASGQTISISNGVVGINDEAHPSIRATPRQYATGLNPHRAFLVVPWPADQPAVDYPTDITDGALDTRIANTHFYSATGADIRVIVDGQEADYWLDGINTTGTSIWCNLSWQAGQAATLASGLGAGPVSSVTVNEDIGGWPSSGLLKIGNELLSYAAKSDATRSFSGIERAARGSSAASHLAGAAAQWIQHEVWLEYGGSAMTAISPDNSRRPMFDLATSTNTTWNYLWFHEAGANRAGAWAFTNQERTQAYGGNQKSAANPYAELGIADATEAEGFKKSIAGYWSLFNPCGMVSANFLSGERNHGRPEWFNATIRSSVTGASPTTHYTLPTGTKYTWAAWSQNVTLVSGARYVYLWLAGYAKSVEPVRVEASQVTVALDSTKTPSALILPEQNVYRMAATLTNQTTGDAIQIEFGLEVDETLRIDVDTHEVVFEPDGSSQFASVASVGGERHRWLRLTPGLNTLRWDEPGLVEVDVEIAFERRYFA